MEHDSKCVQCFKKILALVSVSIAPIVVYTALGNVIFEGFIHRFEFCKYLHYFNNVVKFDCESNIYC